MSTGSSCYLCEELCDICFKPCGHVAMCALCAERVKRCPTCHVSLDFSHMVRVVCLDMIKYVSQLAECCDRKDQSIASRAIPEVNKYCLMFVIVIIH